MKIKETQNNLLKNLTIHLNSITPKSSFKEVYEYAILPPGKLFRPLLVMAIYEDYNKKNSSTLNPYNNHSLLASALEIHHSYTLIHDDLPQMDNDDFRRGKKSTHIQFGEWQAILAGDGLINASYNLLARISSIHTSQIIKLISHFLGPKGLIEGQVIDLGGNAQNSFQQIIKMHELKTSRLIQCAIISSYILANKTTNYREYINLLKLGKYMGLIFQFLDDLTELVEDTLSPHEATVNPWINYPDKADEILNQSLDRIILITKKYKLINFRQVISIYMSKIEVTLSKGEKNINKHCQNQISLTPIMSRLNSISNC